MNDQTHDKARDIARAAKILTWHHADKRATLRDIIRRLIAGKLPEAADAAIVELFDEIEISYEVIMESCGLRKFTDDEINNMPPCPF